MKLRYDPMEHESDCDCTECEALEAVYQNGPLLSPKYHWLRIWDVKLKQKVWDRFEWPLTTQKPRRRMLV